MLSNLYNLTRKNEDSFSIKLANSKHAVFQAHFPGNPLVPGFIMIEICSQVLNHEIIEIKKAKFVNKALPEDTLDFFITQKKSALHVEIKKEEIKIASIVYEKI
jgi:3-hydroxyacyl-[acyl-carrier-protein] dehydratase